MSITKFAEEPIWDSSPQEPSSNRRTDVRPIASRLAISDFVSFSLR